MLCVVSLLFQAFLELLVFRVLKKKGKVMFLTVVVILTSGVKR